MSYLDKEDKSRHISGIYILKDKNIKMYFGHFDQI